MNESKKRSSKYNAIRSVLLTIASLAALFVFTLPIYANNSDSVNPHVPGGDDITLALLIVSGLLAVASFIAFLISLSSIRKAPRTPKEEDKEINK